MARKQDQVFMLTGANLITAVLPAGPPAGAIPIKETP